MAILLGSSRAAELGILFRNAEVLERVGRIDAVMFDKTGTLTEGRPSVVEMIPSQGVAQKDLLRYAVTADQRSEHPYAEAVRRKAAELGVLPGVVDSFEAMPGRGVVVSSFGEKVRVGSLAWLEQEGIEIAGPVSASVREASGSALGVSADGRFLGAILLADRLRESARDAVEWLKAMKMELILVSGDRNRNVHKIAEMVGIGKAYAEVLPLDKSKIVSELQARGKKVAVVGEGFNDAPALSQADIGIALASGTDIASESADITLMNPDLRNLVTAIVLSRRIRLVVRENLAWAFAYNILLIPLAAGAFYAPFGWTLKPQFAGAAMALSSISVVVNSMKLKRFKA
jgi:Cu+-exporting ATPase